MNQAKSQWTGIAAAMDALEQWEKRGRRPADVIRPRRDDRYYARKKRNAARKARHKGGK